MRTFILLTIAALARVGVCDTVLTRTIHTEAYKQDDQEVPASDRQHVSWVGKQRMRVEAEDLVLLIRLDQRKLYVLDAKQKTAAVIDLPFDIKKYVPAEMAPMLAKNAPFATVTPHEQTRKIGAWNTRRYTVSVTGPQGPMMEEVWTTKDLELDWAQFAELSQQVAQLRGGGGTLAEEMKRLEGVPVLTNRVQTVRGAEIRSRETLASVEQKDAPEGHYDVPADYEQKPFDPLAETRARRAAPKK